MGIGFCRGFGEERLVESIGRHIEKTALKPGIAAKQT